MMFAFGSIVEKLKVEFGGTRISGSNVFIEIQNTNVKHLNQIHWPFAHVKAGMVHARRRAAVQYQV